MIKKVALVQPLQRVHVFMRVVVYGSANKDTPQVFKDASFELAKLPGIAQGPRASPNAGMLMGSRSLYHRFVVAAAGNVAVDRPGHCSH
jgi:hypothetical protein